ncbi:MULTISPECIES: tRNA uridine-5-carboxymethylaminomethyl(34) synthesis GTPase MnmE [Shouchella]|uniref:tRNA modification GTPase MnmE n=2 Tax=Shouchella TaxID=2893057 RepID=A0ABY7W8R6_9BACI|nr:MULTISPECIES: tRNA uridine-5-carboxymethylaminomethyl(34) synthesis GTPase MnmE [Shouchella]MED4129863.1 tRNA uridine-5-carboxymethylaminomethyl(34) synthesis GTPase MnmE [Shouchella miscanthi]WDF05315.1 tRNA uridine-5-carboxymethylaminomethyl(34) synthesis GTPase MnmE [Shouchella hunanensis]GAF23301.1 GTPase and tRNA-U34 5-formylation enzyme TrmE [Bacillus sp. JCM 19047]
MNVDTIAAISTALGEGAIGIVRLSGDQAIDISDKLFKGTTKLSDVKTHTITYGHLVESNEVIEEAMVTVMHGPKTYTRENIVEINCHGGLVSVNRVLQAALSHGARLAEPGEFTKRAFLNGRIDLSQAEGVMDLIRSKSDQAMNVAMRQVEGRLSGKIQHLRQQLLETVAAVEVNIDYPEYDAETMTQQIIREKMRPVLVEIDHLLVTAKQGKVLREGLATAIIGRPNVGKSSLMNSLVHESKAIVTDIPGTTRDTLEEYVNVRGVPLRLIDTAGIRETEDIVEKIGVERSRKALKEAELILLVLNNSEPLTMEDEALFEAVEDMDVVIIVNKTDQKQAIDIKKVHQFANGRPVVTTSLIHDEGVDQLEEAIKQLFFAGDIEGQDLTYVSNARHIGLLNEARRRAEDALQATEMDVPVDLIQIDVTRTWELLGEIIGEDVQDSLIDQLFSQFCLGK